MDDRKVKRKLAAIVSTDVKGYSRLMSDDDVETVKSLKACRRIMFRKIEEHRGRLVDSPGDNLLSEFSSVAADPDESAGYGLLGHVYLWTKQHDKGIVQILGRMNEMGLH